jgi:hypothetical protein
MSHYFEQPLSETKERVILDSWPHFNGHSGIYAWLTSLLALTPLLVYATLLCLSACYPSISRPSGPVLKAFLLH